MSAEIWKPIPGYETYYEASNLGRILSWRQTGPRQLTRKTPRLKTPRMLNRVVRVQLSKDGVNKEWTLGELMLRTFVGPKPPGMECAHRDCNPLNNRIENLRWTTHLDNMQDSVQLGTVARGTRHGMNKLSEIDVMFIANSILPQSELATRFGIAQTTVSNIKVGKSWSWLTKIPKKKR